MAKNADLEAELQLWRSLGGDAASVLEEIASTRVSQTMTEHRAAEIMQENNAMLKALASRIRELLGA